MPLKKNKKSLAEKRQAEKNRYQKIKDDPVKWEAQQEKERHKYLKKKEKKSVQSIAALTPRAQRTKRHNWRISSQNYRNNLKTKSKVQQFLNENSPPCSENESEPEVQSARAHQGRKLAAKFRKQRWRSQKQNAEKIEHLEAQILIIRNANMNSQN